MLISDLSSEQLLMLIVPALPNMWALKHAMYHDFPTPKEKYRWMMACVFIPCLGGLAYYFVGRRHASKEKVDIRARIEAERVRAAEEKAAAVDASPESENVPSAAPPSESAPVESGAAEISASSASVTEKRNVRSSVAERTSRAGVDDWSFGCPDDVRKP
ncbi:PLD nuclease N-terminal domain-containing protein [Mailhella sp.]|uniref:PLD nuclease N-terminal domain-containing protein n=1 Tax=Mailhella sp. TaxID=1981029 RepID=UPI003AB3DB50